jgi:hypothetical protein
MVWGGKENPPVEGNAKAFADDASIGCSGFGALTCACGGVTCTDGMVGVDQVVGGANGLSTLSGFLGVSPVPKPANGFAEASGVAAAALGANSAKGLAVAGCVSAGCGFDGCVNDAKGFAGVADVVVAAGVCVIVAAGVKLKDFGSGPNEPIDEVGTVAVGVVELGIPKGEGAGSGAEPPEGCPNGFEVGAATVNGAAGLKAVANGFACATSPLATAAFSETKSPSPSS